MSGAAFFVCRVLLGYSGATGRFGIRPLHGKSFVDHSYEHVGLDEAVAVFGIIIGGGFGGYGFLQGLAGFLGGGNAIADGCERIV